MYDSSKVWLLLSMLPLFSGARVHRAALQALHCEDWGAAERLCGRAAARYRRELSCEALARLRVHQEIARVRSGRYREDAELDIERALARLDCIEALEPPHRLMDAHALMGHWAGSSKPEGVFATDAETPLAA